MPMGKPVSAIREINAAAHMLVVDERFISNIYSNEAPAIYLLIVKIKTGGLCIIGKSHYSPYCQIRTMP
jgi:hypothetical protein